MKKTIKRKYPKAPTPPPNKVHKSKKEYNRKKEKEIPEEHE